MPFAINRRPGGRVIVARMHEDVFPRHAQRLAHRAADFVTRRLRHVDEIPPNDRRLGCAVVEDERVQEQRIEHLAIRFARHPIEHGRLGRDVFARRARVKDDIAFRGATKGENSDDKNEDYRPHERNF